MIAKARRFFALKADRDDGITLVELLVAMGVVVVLSTIVIGAYSSTVQTIGVANTINGNTAQASNGMKEAAREIRAATSNPVAGQATNAPAFVQATNESLVIYAYINLQSASIQQPQMVRLSVDPTTRNFVEDIWPATQNAAGYWIFPSTSTTPTTTIILASVVATRVSPNPYLFTYYAGTTALTVPAAGGFTTAQLLSITSVQITLTVQSGQARSPRPVTLQNTVGIPNLNQ